MPRCLPKARFGPRVPTLTQSQSFTRPFHCSRPVASANPALTSLLGDSDVIRARKLSELLDSLTRFGNASRVWAYYTGLLSLLKNERLPLDLHQQVLRKCTPSSPEVRAAVSRRLVLGNKPRIPHIYEGRLQTVIRNIRALGEVPSLEDYHFILEQFAAAGHYMGAMQVYRELKSLELRPRSKTVGLCLQAIAHRLTQPCSKDGRLKLLEQVRKFHGELLSDMQRHGIGFRSVNFDISVRILKESVSIEGCEKLLKMGYGIDLANPDRPALEYLHDTGIASTDAEALLSYVPAPQPLTTAGLNTIIDMLGRLGNVSKLIQTFEILTQPLPPQANLHFSSAFEDEDDDYSTMTNPPASPNVTLPHAAPNTTTYNTLIRYLAKAGHHTLTRHYIVQAMWLDRKSDRTLRGQLAYGIPPDKVPAPQFAINRGTLLPTFGEANRGKNVSLMRWIQTRIPKILRRKRVDLVFYTQLRDRLTEERSMEEGDVPDLLGSPSLAPSNIQPPNLQPQTTYFSSSPRSGSNGPAPSVLDIDLDSPFPIPLPPSPKYFNVDLHIQVLQRDISELESFSEYVADVIGRTSQRLKERLGRRIWVNKNVYLRSLDQRVPMGRQDWKGQVNFHSRNSVREMYALPKNLGGTFTLAPRRLTTWSAHIPVKMQLPPADRAGPVKVDNPS